MTREESIKWIDEEIRWENECQSKHPIKEALYEARKALEQKTCKYVVSRAEVKKIAKEMYLEVANMELDAKTISDCISCTASKCREVLERKLQAIPPVTPQEPRIGKLIGYIDFLRNTAQGKKKSLNLLEKVVKGELEEIRAEGENFVKPRMGEWIPVTERLPEEHFCNDGYIEPSDYVLVWGNNGSYGVSRYWGNRRSKAKSPNTYKDWVDLDWVVQKPIAWMPLPEPYRTGREE